MKIAAAKIYLKPIENKNLTIWDAIFKLSQYRLGPRRIRWTRGSSQKFEKYIIYNKNKDENEIFKEEKRIQKNSSNSHFMKQTRRNQMTLWTLFSVIFWFCNRKNSIKTIDQWKQEEE